MKITTLPNTPTTAHIFSHIFIYHWLPPLLLWPLSHKQTHTPLHQRGPHFVDGFNLFNDSCPNHPAQPIDGIHWQSAVWVPGLEGDSDVDRDRGQKLEPIGSHKEYHHHNSPTQSMTWFCLSWWARTKHVYMGWGWREINDLRCANFSTRRSDAQPKPQDLSTSRQSRGWLAGQWGRQANMFVFPSPNIEASLTTEDTEDN